MPEVRENLNVDSNIVYTGAAQRIVQQKLFCILELNV